MPDVKVQYSDGAGNNVALPEYVTVIFTLPNGSEIRCRLREDEGDAYVEVYGSGRNWDALAITPWATNRIQVRCP